MKDTRRTRITLALLLLVAFAFITVDVQGGVDSPLKGLRGVGSTIFGPIERAAAAVARPVRQTVSAVAGIGESRERIEELRRENRELRDRLRISRLEDKQAAQAEQLLQLSGLGRYRVVGARVVALQGTHSFENTATIDVGSRDGVEPDMTIVNGDGLIGRVATVGSTTSTVLLATDATSAVGARLEGSDEIGVVNGRGRTPDGSGLLHLELLDPAAPLEPGERIVTFGSQGGQPYAPGVPIGTVRSVASTPGALTKSAVVEPFADFTALGVVGVVVEPPRTDPRDAVLPPKPPTGSSPSPSASGGSRRRR